MSATSAKPAVFVVDGCIIDLQDVSTVICATEIGARAPVCRVILRSGVSFTIARKYSRSLIQAVELSRASGIAVRPTSN